MTRDPALRKSTIDEIFTAALDLPEDEREPYVARACKGDTSLENVVRRLLLASEATCHFLEPAGAHQGPLWHQLSTELINGRSVQAGDRIGAYQIIRELGSGGMAVVFLARRADGQYRHDVALKIVKNGRTRDDLTLRFQQERQILASLDHPGIARLIDGGVTRDGRPVMVMELVDGEPIDAYCDHHRLTVEERLQLFAEVVQAAHYAHQNLVVHRDLKPSNILVTSAGRVKLLDFGIAKLLDHEKQQLAAPVTRTSVRVLTPEYASPEQLRGGPITTASDVYQLGLLLYKLLCGCRAYHLQGRTPSEIEQMICDQEPPPPSAALSLARDAEEDGRLADRVSELRQTRPERLRKRLKGDLDTIVLMALRKEPDRRYGTVEQLGQDIERHLAGRPVSARRSTFGYRLYKLIKRHTMAAAASISTVLLIAAVIVFYTSRLADERDRARLEAEKANQVSSYLEGLFQATDSFQSRGEEISAAAMLDQKAQRIATELEDQPELQAEMKILLANIYRRLGKFDDAAGLLEQVVSARSRLAGDQRVASASSMIALANVYTNQGRLMAAEPLYIEAISSLEEELDPNDLRLADARCHLATLYLQLARVSEAEDLLRQVVTARELKLGESDPLVLESNAALLSAQRRYDEAEPLYRKALEIRRRTLGPDHIDVAFCLRRIGRIAANQGDWSRAERLHREELGIIERFYGPNHFSLGYTLRRLASCAVVQGQYRKADELYERALMVQETAYDSRHPSLAATLFNLARNKAIIGEIAAANRLLLRALSIYEEKYGENHSKVARCLNNLAYNSWVQGLEGDTEAYLRRALELLEAREQATVSLATVLDTQACLLIDQGKLAMAESQLRRSVAILEQLLGMDHPYLAEVLMNLARLRTRQGRYAEASASFDRALAITRKLHQSNPESLSNRCHLASVLAWQGEMFQRLGDHGQALACWNEADTITEPFTGETEAVVALSIRASVLLRLGRVSEAEPLVNKVLATGWRRSDLTSLCRQHGLPVTHTFSNTA
jgi:serine/threonine-protein kinase